MYIRVILIRPIRNLRSRTAEVIDGAIDTRHRALDLCHVRCYLVLTSRVRSCLTDVGRGGDGDTIELG